MRNLLIALVGAAVLGTGGYAAASGLDDADPARTISLPGATTGAGETTTTTGETTAGTGTTTTGEAHDDISGPCDEAEHADDPRCAGGVATGDDDGDDDHGERGGDDDEHDDDDEDRSGSNSGRG
jgi:hypothetical protein